MGSIPNSHGGGAKTNVNGLRFERATSLDEALVKAGYRVENRRVYANDRLVGMSVPKNSVYKDFLDGEGINFATVNSKKWLPDECFINFDNRRVYIIEKKFQERPGSTDEKLVGCHFKRGEYHKLFRSLGYEVDFIYVFNDWFKASIYEDTLDYINYMGCHYFYNNIPLMYLGLEEVVKESKK